MIAINLPLTSAFGDSLRKPFAAYYYHSGTWQYWAMFETIPRYRSVHPKLVASWKDRRPRTYGALLPGLKRYRHSTRLGSLYIRYVWQSQEYVPVIRAYLLNGCKEIQAKSGAKPETVSLRLDTQTLIPLPQVRASGKEAQARRDTSPVVVSCP